MNRFNNVQNGKNPASNRRQSTSKPAAPHGEPKCWATAVRISSDESERRVRCTERGIQSLLCRRSSEMRNLLLGCNT